jgi:O-antigen/teichoic acid export membrane protein
VGGSYASVGVGELRRFVAAHDGEAVGNHVHADQHASHFRAKRLKYAIATSLLSKGGTAMLQLVAIPIAIRSLGVHGYALYAGIVATVGWLGMAMISVGPAIVVQMAAAAAVGDERAQRRLFASAAFPIGVNTIILAAVVLILASFCQPTRLFHSDFADEADAIRICLWIMAAIQLTQPLFALIEAAQTAYQEQHFQNLGSLLGNLGCVASLALISYWPTVTYMVLAMQIPTFVSRLANAVWFFRRRAFLIPSVSSFHWDDCRSLVGNGILFSIAGTTAAYLCHQFPVLILGWTLGSLASASFAAGMSLIVVPFGIVSMICIPLWPAISDSLSRGNIAWVRLACLRLVSVCTAYGIVVGLILALFGRVIFRTWLGNTLQPSSSFFLSLGLYFPLLVWEYVHYMMLIGLRDIRLPSILYVTRGVVSAAMIFGLSGVGRDYVAFSMLCLSASLLTGVSYPCLFRRAFNTHTTLGVVAIPERSVNESQSCDRLD